MSRKWVEKEGLGWVEKNIISREQYDQIVQLYAEQKHAIGMLPLLGSVLLGLGILSFIAANWQEIPQLLRLLMIVVVMVGFYAGGEQFLRKGHGKLGIALTALGLVSFGAGIILVGQMFHLVAYDLTSFTVWGLAGIVLTYMYRSRFLYLISLLIFTGAQWYSTLELHQFSYAALVIMAVGLGYFTWQRQSTLLTWCYSLSFVLQCLMLVFVKDWPLLWLFIPVMALYAAGDWIRDRSSGYAVQTVPLIAAYVFAVSMVLLWDIRSSSDLDEILAQPAYYLIALVVLFAISVLGKLRQARGSSAFEWILLAPFVYLPGGIEVLYLLALFFFSFYVLWRGYMEQWRFKINFGTVLFLCSTMVAYGKLTWDFMDKSLFFIIGGLLLLALSWVLNRRKKQVLEDTKGGKTS
ncbi:DUF2157 domain-containing protein [Paenibacillus sp. TAB 01]|uniref:DUF2157 domain-containing protein n=1 Tax=Paenibacillus sp. TAB 01 TaxID=3368988 RepID=UPI0037534BED